MESPVTEPATDTAWWGSFRLEAGQWGCWAVGPLDLWLRRLPSEWILAPVVDAGPEDRAAQAAVPAAGSPPLDAGRQTRFVEGETRGPVELSPGLADRPVVTRPEGTLFLLAGEEVCLYVSSPLWVRVEAGEPRGLLAEMPIARPSDTWFGPSSREGELAYAARTRACTDPAALPRSPCRAVTMVRLRNETRTPMPLERLSLPAPNLSLYAGGDGRLWTEPLALTLGPDPDAVSLVMEKQPPPAVPEPRLVREPRARPERNRLVRALGSLIR
ncbi:MAG TPA: hypothetical protein VKA48_13380 [Gammaproteobacteria bacterium]|nr:hypothetical protein [Gammaproteobacteria bacterium]